MCPLFSLNPLTTVTEFRLSATLRKKIRIMIESANNTTDVIKDWVEKLVEKEIGLCGCLRVCVRAVSSFA